MSFHYFAVHRRQNMLVQKLFNESSISSIVAIKWNTNNKFEMFFK
jgi:hypothetical protein